MLRIKDFGAYHAMIIVRSLQHSICNYLDPYIMCFFRSGGGGGCLGNFAAE